MQCNGITYRYVVSTGKRGFATLEPAPIGLLNDGFAVTPRRVLEVQPIPYQEPDNLEDTARHRVNQKKIVVERNRPGTGLIPIQIALCQPRHWTAKCLEK